MRQYLNEPHIPFTSEADSDQGRPRSNLLLSSSYKLAAAESWDDMGPRELLQIVDLWSCMVPSILIRWWCHGLLKMFCILIMSKYKWYPLKCIEHLTEPYPRFPHRNSISLLNYIICLSRYDFRKRVAQVLQVETARVSILANSPSSAADGRCQQVNFMISGMHPSSYIHQVALNECVAL